jgi:uncharacterized membrane protein HdeD (DUF308 family)
VEARNRAVSRPRRGTSGRGVRVPWSKHASTAISARREIEVWWLQLIAGIVYLALGFWAAGYYGRSAVLLVAWVAAFAIIRGVTNIVLAFRVRELQHAAPT